MTYAELADRHISQALKEVWNAKQAIEMGIKNAELDAEEGGTPALGIKECDDAIKHLEGVSFGMSGLTKPSQKC